MSRRLRLTSFCRSWDCNQLAVAIGRGAANDVVIEDATVSKSHATIVRIAGEFFVQAEDSANGTRLNGVPVPPNSWQILSHGDRLTLGSTVLEVGVLGEPRPGAGLVLINGPHRGSGFVLKDEALVGRGSQCQLRLDDPEAALEHARLRPLADRWTIVELDTTVGVVVNGQRIHGERVLAHRDEILLGATRLVYVNPAANQVTGSRALASKAATPPQGKSIGPYRLRRVLGRGGMGIVWEAEHAETGHRYAIKLLAESQARDADAVERFLREAQLANEIPHDGIVQVFDSGITREGTPYLVMELLYGESLAARLKRLRRLPEEEVRRIGSELADILSAVHAAGVVHRDLKPENVYCVETGEGEAVRLLDLGIAKALGMEQLTKTGELIGTAAYLAPEQCMDARSVGPRADIYALGCILFEMVAGRPPFSGSVLALMQQHVSSTPPRAASLASISEELDEIISRCLRKRPDARLPSMVALRRELAGQVFRRRRLT